VASNRLFIYDPDTNDAVCIGKGYSSGWSTNVDYIDKWFDSHGEYTGDISETRFKLKTENDLPYLCTVTYQS